MRNEYEYPYTTSEIVDLLKRLRDREQERIEENMTCGDPTCMLLDAAIRRIQHETTFSLRRIDDNGNIAVVRDGMTKRDALRLYDLLTARGHKQVYHVVTERKPPPEDVDDASND